MPGIKHLLPFLLLLALINNGCVTINDIRTCTVDGVLSAGGNCSHLISTTTEKMTMDEFITFLEADPKLNKGSAICISASDYNNLKTDLEHMCRMLGKRCAYGGSQNEPETSAE